MNDVRLPRPEKRSDFAVNDLRYSCREVVLFFQVNLDKEVDY
jgi:hypothetical protein